MKIVIVYKGALAFYEVSKDRDGVFNAFLKQYGGFETPADKVTLARGLRHWSGSVDDVELLYELGEAIDRNRKQVRNQK